MVQKISHWTRNNTQSTPGIGSQTQSFHRHLETHQIPSAAITTPQGTILICALVLIRNLNLTECLVLIMPHSSLVLRMFVHHHANISNVF